MKQKQKISTARLGDKLFVFNGIDPLAYVDLTKVNKGNKSKVVIRYTPSKYKNIFNYYYKIAKGKS